MRDESFETLGSWIEERTYSRPELNDLIYRLYPAYSESSCNWVIGELCSRGIIAPIGNGFFVPAKEDWAFELPQRQEKILEILRKEFPYSSFALTNSAVIDAFMGQESAMEYLLFQVDKRDVFPCYMRVRELSKQEVLISPTSRELSFYLKPKSIIVTPLFSKSPSQKDGHITIEKLLVDLFAERLFQSLYVYEANKEILREYINKYNVNLITCLNYAKRRRCQKEIKELLVEATPSYYWNRFKEDL